MSTTKLVREQLEDELAESIRGTLHREAVQNEQSIAVVRVLLMAVVAATDLYWAVMPGGESPLWARVPSFAYFFVALVVFWALRTGRYHRSVGYVAPLGDALFIFLRAGATMLARDHPMDTMVAIFGAHALLIVSGTFRLKPFSLWGTTVLGVAGYFWFAVRAGFHVSDIIIQVSMLLAFAGLSQGLMRLVQRAMRSEVARLTLSRFLPERVIAGAHSDPLKLITEPRSMDVTVMMTDLRGFTTWAESRKPMEVLAFLNRVQGSFAAIVREEGGTVDKFLGDGMLAVFGAPDVLEGHADAAVRAAERIREAIAGEEVLVGVGVHSGEVVVGCLGSGRNLEFTILGDTVNTAARLEKLTKEAGQAVLISGATAERLTDASGLAELGEVSVRGRVGQLQTFGLK